MSNIMIKKANALKPALCHKTITLKQNKVLKEGEKIVFDFGDHFVGYLTVKFSTVGSHQDAPALVKFKFCETEREINEDTLFYRGWISKSWLQEEVVHIDVLPHVLRLPRRYAFRYVVISAEALSSKYNLVVNYLSLDSVTSAPEEIAVFGKTEREKTIDKVALRTLSECMQYEFEDGPKRDRRLWLGDLRLQALTNYKTYKHNDLVKRCLYLFAGTAKRSGEISSCVFTKPRVASDDTYLFDYSLLFISALYDYVNETGDLSFGKELYELAVKQLVLAQKRFNADVVCDSDEIGWCFLDWNLALNKQCGAQAVYVYAAKAAKKLSELLKKDAKWIDEEIERKSKALLDNFYDKKLKLFVSGKDKQISYASNVWACLAEVIPEKERASLLSRLEKTDCVKPVTPYMYHHYIQALIDCGQKEKARKVMTKYWGAMVDVGADTFYELFNPENPEESPYGNRMVNSYCHAWSCTPAYFLREFFAE